MRRREERVDACVDRQRTHGRSGILPHPTRLLQNEVFLNQVDAKDTKQQFHRNVKSIAIPKHRTIISWVLAVRGGFSVRGDDRLGGRFQDVDGIRINRGEVMCVMEIGSGLTLRICARRKGDGAHLAK